MKNITTIVIEKNVRDKLKSMGTKGDTYNDLIKELIGFDKNDNRA